MEEIVKEKTHKEEMRDYYLNECLRAESLDRPSVTVSREVFARFLKSI